MKQFDRISIHALKNSELNYYNFLIKINICQDLNWLFNARCDKNLSKTVPIAPRASLFASQLTKFIKLYATNNEYYP